MRAPLVTGKRTNVAAIQLHSTDFLTGRIWRGNPAHQLHLMLTIGQILLKIVNRLFNCKLREKQCSKLCLLPSKIWLSRKLWPVPRSIRLVVRGHREELSSLSPDRDKCHCISSGTDDPRDNGECNSLDTGTVRDFYLGRDTTEDRSDYTTFLLDISPNIRLQVGNP